MLRAARQSIGSAFASTAAAAAGAAPPPPRRRSSLLERTASLLRGNTTPGGDPGVDGELRRVLEDQLMPGDQIAAMLTSLSPDKKRQMIAMHTAMASLATP